MPATKHTNPVVSVRLEGDMIEQLQEMQERYPLFSRSQMVNAAMKHWLHAALKNGVDFNLQPLKGK